MFFPLCQCHHVQGKPDFAKRGPNSFDKKVDQENWRLQLQQPRYQKDYAVLSFIRRTMQGWNWFLYCVEKKLSSVQLHQIISSSSKSHLSFALHLQPAWNYILRLKKHVLSFISTDTVSTFLPMHILQAECLIFLPISPGSPDSDGGSLSNIHSLALALEQHVRLFSVFADFRFYKANDAISKTLLKSVFIL